MEQYDGGNLQKPIIPFIQVSNKILYSNKLSLKAKGLYCYLLANPTNDGFNPARIALETKEGVSSITSGLKELVSAGLLKHNISLDFKFRYIFNNTNN